MVADLPLIGALSTAAMWINLLRSFATLSAALFPRNTNVARYPARNNYLSMVLYNYSFKESISSESHPCNVVSHIHTIQTVSHKRLFNSDTFWEASSRAYCCPIRKLAIVGFCVGAICSSSLVFIFRYISETCLMVLIVGTNLHIFALVQHWCDSVLCIVGWIKYYWWTLLVPEEKLSNIYPGYWERSSEWDFICIPMLHVLFHSEYICWKLIKRHRNMQD